jgi:hypothetical protein
MMSGARVLEPLVVLSMAYLSYLTGSYRHLKPVSHKKPVNTSKHVYKT